MNTSGIWKDRPKHADPAGGAGVRRCDIHAVRRSEKRVALASVLLSAADLLVLDEPTNHLDSSMADWLEDYLKNSEALSL